MSRGDFVDFDIANEDDVLEEFLGLPRKHAKVELVNTGAVANEVGQFTSGKLNSDEKVTLKFLDAIASLATGHDCLSLTDHLHYCKHH